jgi:hypothetical protein
MSPASSCEQTGPRRGSPQGSAIVPAKAACRSHVLHATSADAGLSVRVCDTLHPLASSRHPASGRANPAQPRGLTQQLVHEVATAVEV